MYCSCLIVLINQLKSSVSYLVDIVCNLYKFTLLCELLILYIM